MIDPGYGLTFDCGWSAAKSGLYRCSREQVYRLRLFGPTTQSGEGRLGPPASPALQPLACAAKRFLPAPLRQA
ncbi:hypothetical protein ACVJGD_001479 [Bradyrhizobium sp. USDA 10063]